MFPRIPLPRFVSACALANFAPERHPSQSFALLSADLYTGPIEHPSRFAGNAQAPPTEPAETLPGALPTPRGARRNPPGRAETLPRRHRTLPGATEPSRALPKPPRGLRRELLDPAARRR